MNKVIGVTLAVALVLISGTIYYGSKTIHDLFGENAKLKEAISRLTQEDQIGYAKVVSQEVSENGKVLSTTLKFVETARGEPRDRILEKEYTIAGDIVHFDALIVTFPTSFVMDGKERSLYLWRRIYGEQMKPADAFPIEEEGKEPQRYKDLLARLGQSDREEFWGSIWELSNDPDALRKHGIRAVYGNVVYKKLEKGLIYVFKIDQTGQVFPETVPDM